MLRCPKCPTKVIIRNPLNHSTEVSLTNQYPNPTSLSIHDDIYTEMRCACPEKLEYIVRVLLGLSLDAIFHKEAIRKKRKCLKENCKEDRVKASGLRNRVVLGNHEQDVPGHENFIIRGQGTVNSKMYMGEFAKKEKLGVRVCGRLILEFGRRIVIEMKKCEVVGRERSIFEVVSPIILTLLKIFATKTTPFSQLYIHHVRESVHPPTLIRALHTSTASI